MHVLLLSALLRLCSNEMSENAPGCWLKLYVKVQRCTKKRESTKNALRGGVCVVDQSRATLFLSHLSSASPSAGVSNIEIRKITMHGEKMYSATRDKISAKRMHEILTHLPCRELADDDRPAHNHRLPWKSVARLRRRLTRECVREPTAFGQEAKVLLSSPLLSAWHQRQPGANSPTVIQSTRRASCWSDYVT